ncbi:MAG TPA: DUF2075 domain-containing protein [Chitinophagaceae bacterium]|nr:DUF2075 domain-containing protein [Chitinophagaceae bacterium]
MIIYQETKEKFLEDVLNNRIDGLIQERFRLTMYKNTNPAELNSWRNSMLYMKNALEDPEIAGNCGVAIEYKIPQTSKRIDFLLSGYNSSAAGHVVLVELKQWEKAELTDQDAIVNTFIGKGIRAQNHPSYQAWTYASLLDQFNEAVYRHDIRIKPCAYLHNYTDDGVLSHEHYQEYFDKAPLFFREDLYKFREFIKKFVRKGDKGKLLFKIENGKIRPSRNLADALASMLAGNPEFLMIDEQKIIFETALSLIKKAKKGKKQVLIVKGGPGTGKSVVAVQLLVAVTQMRKLIHYVTKNAAPRKVYESKLTGKMTRTQYENLFKGSGAYHNCIPDTLDALIVDEAHRLRERSGLFGNLGENQIKEIIRSSKSAVFFIDEDQRVTLHDIGSREEIRKWAHRENAEITECELSSQFRCNGSDGYLAWLDQVLQIRETANYKLNELDYDFRVFDSPEELREVIFEKNLISNKARLVAGYCWDWISKKNPKEFDIIIGDRFRMQWNLQSYGNLWLINRDSVNQVGCIHTCQGLELDYIGVIIGPDLIFRNNKICTDPSKRSHMDTSVRGYRTLLKKEPLRTPARLDLIIKNTYRTLMTRGTRGCYVYCTDPNTSDYFKELKLNHFK